MKQMKNHSTKLSLIISSSQSSPISFTLSNYKPSLTSPRALTPRRAGFILLLMAVSASLSILRVNVPPFRPCSIHHGQHNNNGAVGAFDHIWATHQSYNGSELWKQPNGMGFKPCLKFSHEYRMASLQHHVNSIRRRYLMAVVSGGLNQQKNQIVDAVVLARVLGARLVLPVLQVNGIWGDESEFSDIFDDRHFKETLKDDVHVVSSLPARHLRRRPGPSPVFPEREHIDEEWISTHLMPRLEKERVLILRGFDSRLSKVLSPDLQKLRCKVAFQALRFRERIEELGEKLATRMSNSAPYLALHLRLEKDVWVRTGCLPGLGDELDRRIEIERRAHPELLTSKSNISSHRRYLEGLCPLNALEITRLLKGLGASKNTRIYWAGGVPYGGELALKPLQSEFPNFFNKWSLTKNNELDDIKSKPSLLAALDYIVCLRSQVFLANHGGNMARSMQGHRAFSGHVKHITPNKRQLVQLFMNKSMDECEMTERIRAIQADSLGSPVLRTDKPTRDVIAFPAPDCMCSSKV